MITILVQKMHVHAFIIVNAVLPAREKYRCFDYSIRQKMFLVASLFTGSIVWGCHFRCLAQGANVAPSNTASGSLQQPF
jgi:hypothetical protein